MGLRIKRQNDTRQIPCIQHRIADIPGGVTLDSSTLGGPILYEGTPIAVGAAGKFNVCKTAKVVTEAANNAVSIEIAKGSHLKVGDVIGRANAVAQAMTITAIDKTTNADKDVLTVDLTSGVVLAVGTILEQVAVANLSAVMAVEAAADATDYKVLKGHSLAVGMHLTKAAGSVSKTITAIDASRADYDTITLDATLGYVCAAGIKLYSALTKAAAPVLKSYQGPATNAPVAIVGSSYDVTASDNLICEAFLIAVVKEATSVPVNAAQKTALKSIIYI